MDNEEILEKALQKAVDGGWDSPDSINRVAGDLAEDCNCYGSLYDIIFSHDFAKALWGEEPSSNYFGKPGIPYWQYHLQQMVIAEDPIKYLGENL